MKSYGINGFRAIPGYEGRYEIDYHANIRRIWIKSGKRTTMRPSIKNGENVIKLSDTNEKRQWYKVAHVMAITFIAGYKKGDSVFHIDGVKNKQRIFKFAYCDKKRTRKDNRRQQPKKDGCKNYPRRRSCRLLFLRP